MEKPNELIAELTRMRQNPTAFRVVKLVYCTFCPKKSKQTPDAEPRAFSLASQGEDAGTWCHTHGWLHFNSSQFPPTERLTITEVQDRREASKRSEEYQRRKAAKKTAVPGNTGQERVSEL